MSNDVGRNAYFAAFHAAQAFIFERTSKAAKTHQGVQSELNRMARDEPGIDKSFPAFLSQAYNLKAVADYETGPDSVVPPERSASAIETAGRFIDCAEISDTHGGIARGRKNPIVRPTCARLPVAYGAGGGSSPSRGKALAVLGRRSSPSPPR